MSRLLIAGSRTITDYDLLVKTIGDMEISEVISGGALGVDQLGELWARNNNIPVTQLKPDWKLYGRSAGIRRNTQLVELADAAIILWDGQSKGTKDTITKCQKKGIPVTLVTV